MIDEKLPDFLMALVVDAAKGTYRGPLAWWSPAARGWRCAACDGILGDELHRCAPKVSPVRYDYARAKLVRECAELRKRIAQVRR